ETVTDEETQQWSRIAAGEWLSKTLEALRRPEAALDGLQPGDELKADLRPYQQTGFRWLHLLSSLGLGACLADDMGLGKTMQVLALMLVLDRAGSLNGPSLLVAPASLLANWTSEIERFAPTVTTLVAHPSVMPSAEIRAIDENRVKDVDLVITSYGSLVRVPGLLKLPWQLAIIDEAQAIKNPGTRQTRTVKQIHAKARIALTGTPVENRLGDLWSIFDFINPGLLGSAKEFTAFAKSLADRPNTSYSALRQLVQPY